MSIFNKKKLWIALTSVFFVLFAIFLCGTFVLNNYFNAVNMVLRGKTYILTQTDGAEAPVYFKSSHGEVNGAVLLASDSSICEEVVGEGATLLWNDGALPLDSGSLVSCFNKASVSLVETGTGSGYIATDPQNSATVAKAFAQADVDLKINPTLQSFYISGAGKNYNRTNKATSCSKPNPLNVAEVPWSVYTSDVKSSFVSYPDAAILFFARTGGEAYDLNMCTTDTPDNDYLRLSDAEISVLDSVVQLKKQNVFKSIIVMINTSNQLSMEWMKDYRNDVDACMWMGQPGMFGMNAIANILVGNIIPSGHLPDTYCYSNASAPAVANFGGFSYTNASNVQGIGPNPKEKDKYVVYQEGIYVGYKYYETRYEDTVLSLGNATDMKGSTTGSAWNYDAEVAFPFGHGLSYTGFEYSDFTVTKNSEGDYNVSVTVKNSGNYAGKDAVQIYLQKPYTQYDIDNGLEKSAVELVAYAKTPIIEPDKSIQVKLTVSKHEFKTYDNEIKKTFILEGGKYYLTAAYDAHAAINNILDAKIGGNRGNGSLAKELEISEDLKTFSKSQYDKSVAITNRLDDVDMNKYSGNGGNSVTYLTRNDWRTFPSTAALLSMSPELVRDVQYDKAFTESESIIDLPEYGKYQKDENGKDIQYSAAMMIGLSYDHEMWDVLLDQMTWEEQAKMCANAYHQTEAIASINLPGAYQENGPLGITKRSDFGVPNASAIDWTFISYPCSPIAGATFNDELIEKMGEHKSEDMLYLGYNGIYGPGANLHRSAYGGRAYEYPSEDEFLAGKICSAEVRGIESLGCMAFIKHYAFNDQETNRSHASIWANEQAGREVYLRAFEYVFTEGGASATMNSFSRAGALWCGANKPLLIDILRNEWLFDGIIITDWDGGGTMSKIDAILAGTNSWDGNNNETVYEPYRYSPTVCANLRESAKRIIFKTIHTNAMNGIGSNTKVIPVLTWWQLLLIAGDITFGVLALAAVAMLVTGIALRKRKAN